MTIAFLPRDAYAAAFTKLCRLVDVQSVDVFKVHLDQFWAQQEVMFDWTADLTGTGDRSEYTVESN